MLVILLCVVFIVPEFVALGLTWEGIFASVGLIIVYASMAYRNKLLHFNDKTK